MTLTTDLLLLAAHTAYHFRGWEGPAWDWLGAAWRPSVWDGGTDRSLLELFGHLQLTIAAILLARCTVRRRGHQVLFAWALAFLAMAVDDFYRLHEHAGEFLALDRAQLGLTDSGARELGGLVFWIGSVLVLGAGLLVYHQRSSSSARAKSFTLLAIVMPLAVVAVGYVALSALHPEVFETEVGLHIALVRVAAKVLTMTALLLYALRLNAGPPRRVDL